MSARYDVDGLNDDRAGKGTGHLFPQPTRGQSRKMASLLQALPYIAVAIVLLVSLLTVMSVDDWSRDWTTNHAQLQATSTDPLLRPQTLSGPPTAIADALESEIGRLAPWSLIAREQQAGEVRLHLTHRTRLLRFVDDVHVTLTADEGATRVTASSRSRVGKGDLGQNPRNLKALVEILLSISSPSSEAVDPWK